MLLGHSAQLPQRVLQPARQRLEAFAAEHHFDVAPSRVCERELIQPVWQRPSLNQHAESRAVGEITQAESTWRMRLREIDLVLSSVRRPPLPQPPLQRAQQRWRHLDRIAPLQFFQDRYRVERGRRRQQRRDVRLPPGDSGSARVRHCRVACCDGKPPARSIRRAERTLMPTFAATASCSNRFRCSMYLATCVRLMRLPDIGALPRFEEARL